MEQIEKLAKLVNMEPLLVILIGAGVILIVFGLAAAIAARRRKRVARAREKALKKAGGIDQIVSSCERINKPFSNILLACWAFTNFISISLGFFIASKIAGFVIS